MKIFKYRLFEKWAKRKGVSDDDLRKTVVGNFGISRHHGWFIFSHQPNATTARREVPSRASIIEANEPRITIVVSIKRRRPKPTRQLA